MTRLCIWLVVSLAGAPSVAAQPQFNPRDDQYRALGLVRAKAELDRTRAHAARATQLSLKGVMSDAERDDRVAEFERARVDYAQQLLAIAKSDGHVTVARAVKVRTLAGQSRVRITLASAPRREVSQMRALVLDRESEVFLPGGGVDDVIVSVKDAAGANGITIARPYERHLSRVGATPTTIAFDLLRESEDVVIAMAYGGRLEERRVLLEQEAGIGVSAWRVEQFSQTADLGTEAQYGLTLERMTDDARPVRLSVTGLPTSVEWEFRDAETRAKLTQIQFQPGQLQRRLQLVLSLPVRATDAMPPERPVKFAAVATLGDAALGGKATTSTASLDITPRSLARAELHIDNLLVEARVGDSLETVMRVRNTGARTLHGLHVVAELPTGWTAGTMPSVLPPLRAAEELVVAVKLRYAASVIPGDYEAAIRIAGDGLRDTGVPARVLRIRLSDTSGGPWLLVGIVSLLLATGVYALRAVRAAAR